MIVFASEPDLPAQEFCDVLVSSTLAQRRPVDDLGRLDQMLRQADIIVTARENGKLIGISRAISDFSYCCYLSDLAVDAAYQRQGIGKRLIAETRAPGRRSGHAASGRGTVGGNLLLADRYGACAQLLEHRAHPVRIDRRPCG